MHVHVYTTEKWSSWTLTFDRTHEMWTGQNHTGQTWPTGLLATAMCDAVQKQIFVKSPNFVIL